MLLLFDDYAKKLKDLGDNVPEIFRKVAGQGALYSRNMAVKITNQEGLVDTGAYRNTWQAKRVQLNPNTYAIVLYNPQNYASHLEWGHKMRNGKEWRGRFVGRRSLDETSAYCIEKLDDALDKAIVKYHKGML